MRATTILGAALIALSTAAIAQVATAPVENKTNTTPVGNDTSDTPANTSVGNTADPTSLGVVPGDPTATTSAPPK